MPRPRGLVRPTAEDLAASARTLKLPAVRAEEAIVELSADDLVDGSQELAAERAIAAAARLRGVEVVELSSDELEEAARTSELSVRAVLAAAARLRDANPDRTLERRSSPDALQAVSVGDVLAAGPLPPSMPPPPMAPMAAPLAPRPTPPSPWRHSTHPVEAAPSSIAPFALDMPVLPPATPPPRLADATAAFRPPSPMRGLALAALGAVAVLAVGGGVLAVRADASGTPLGARHAAARPPVPVEPAGASPTAAVLPATVLPATVLPATVSPTSAAASGTTPSHATRRAHAPPSSAPLRGVEPTKAPRTVDPAPAGTIRTFRSAAGKPITLDGKVVGTAPGPLEVACGHHAVQVGASAAQDVEIPCGRTITVGRPE